MQDRLGFRSGCDVELIRINLKKTETGYTVRQNRVRTVRREEKPLAFVVDDAVVTARSFTKRWHKAPALDQCIITKVKSLQALGQTVLQSMMVT